MRAALVIGGASHLDSDLAQIGGLDSWPGVVIGVNHAAYTFSRLDAVATLHPEHIAKWREKRAEAGYPDVPFWTFNADPRIDALVWRDPNVETWVGGSSGLFAAGLARLRLGFGPVLLAGVGLEDGRNRYGTNHSDYHRYRDCWTTALAKGWLDGVVSLSPVGTFTRDLLGDPSEAIREAG